MCDDITSYQISNDVCQLIQTNYPSTELLKQLVNECLTDEDASELKQLLVVLANKRPKIMSDINKRLQQIHITKNENQPLPNSFSNTTVKPTKFRGKFFLMISDRFDIYLDIF